jgi:hypothetical protein
MTEKRDMKSAFKGAAITTVDAAGQGIEALSNLAAGAGMAGKGLGTGFGMTVDAAGNVAKTASNVVGVAGAALDRRSALKDAGLDAKIARLKVISAAKLADQRRTAELNEAESAQAHAAKMEKFQKIQKGGNKKTRKTKQRRRTRKTKQHKRTRKTQRRRRTRKNKKN